MVAGWGDAVKSTPSDVSPSLWWRRVGHKSCGEFSLFQFLISVWCLLPVLENKIDNDNDGDGDGVMIILYLNSWLMYRRSYLIGPAYWFPDSMHHVSVLCPVFTVSLASVLKWRYRKLQHNVGIFYNWLFLWFQSPKRKRETCSTSPTSSPSKKLKVTWLEPI